MFKFVKLFLPARCWKIDAERQKESFQDDEECGSPYDIKIALKSKQMIIQHI